MEMLEFGIKFVLWAIKNYDLFMVFAGVLVLLLNGTASPASALGLVMAIAGGVIFAMRKGLIDKIKNRNKEG